jgi:decaprenyl-phosphate phosphoribosyltransferase
MANTQKQIVKDINIFSTLWHIFLAGRPVHWIKNLSLFAALIFSGNLFLENYLNRVIFAFFSFSLASSATYIFNDIFDIEADKLHPLKKKRPIPSGKIPLPIAGLATLVCVVISLYIASLLNTLFFLAVFGYLTLQAAYSLGLKNIATIDILVIAAGFIIRIYSGAFVIDAHLSVWFLLCVISLALFLAAGKRRSEIGVVENIGTTRKSLINYKRELLNSYVTMFGNAAWMSWALFTFFESPTTTTPVWIFLAELSRTTAISKLLMITIPIVIFGIMRYEGLIFEDKSEAPEKVLLTDKSLISSIVLWTVLVVWILYSGIAVPID